MLLQARPQRHRLGIMGILGQCGHVGRRLRRRRAQQIVQYPLAPENRRGAGGKRRDRQHAAVAEQPATVAIGKGHPAKSVTNHVGNVVVLGQPAIHKRVVGGEQIGDVAILADDAHEEQLSFTLHGIHEALVRVRIVARIGRPLAQVAQVEPLRREVPGERLGPLVRQHPANLRLEHSGIAQLAGGGEPQKRLVRRAAPQKE